MTPGDNPSDATSEVPAEVPAEVDPLIGEHVVAIRNRFGVDGLREAQRLIETEIAMFEDAYDDLPN